MIDSLDATDTAVALGQQHVVQPGLELLDIWIHITWRHGEGEVRVGSEVCSVGGVTVRVR